MKVPCELPVLGIIALTTTKKKKKKIIPHLKMGSCQLDRFSKTIISVGGKTSAPLNLSSQQRGMKAKRVIHYNLIRFSHFILYSCSTLSEADLPCLIVDLILKIYIIIAVILVRRRGFFFFFLS